jgi:hypothetical protein
MRVEFAAGREPKLAVSQRVGDTRQGHFPVMAKFLTELVKVYGCDDLNGSLAIWLHDGAPYGAPWHSRKLPLLAFSRHVQDSESFLMPDPAFLREQGYKEDRLQLDKFKLEVPWELRQPVLFWRGANTGLEMYGPDWKQAARIRLACLSKQINQPECFDACISKVLDYGDARRAEEIRAMGIVGDYLPMIDFFDRRYQVDVDGESCAWVSLFLKLYSGSLVVKVQSDWQQWYYDRLKNGENYIELKKDLSDLPALLDWISAHDQECKTIGEKAAALAKEVTYETSAREVAALLRQILACQRE